MLWVRAEQALSRYRAWQEAQEQMVSMGDPLDIFDYVYAELPPYLAEQRQAFQQFPAR